MEEYRTLDEFYEAICDRIRKGYVERGEDVSDEEMKKAADNLLQFCDRIAEIEIDGQIKFTSYTRVAQEGIISNFSCQLIADDSIGPEISKYSRP